MASVGVVTIFIASCVNYVFSYCSYGIIEQGVTEDDRRLIVDHHNYLRGLISQGKIRGQPRATNMKHMSYSNSLEYQAQQLTNSCKFEHQPVEGTQWEHVGQNLYLSYSYKRFTEGANFTDAIQSWFDEHKVYRFGSRSRPGRVTGHYTQLVWADTDHVGCGYTQFTKDGGSTYEQLIACNYAPGGNYIGQEPYKT